MDAEQLMKILDDYENKVITFAEASFKLVNLGCDADEAILLLSN